MKLTINSIIVIVLVAVGLSCEQNVVFKKPLPPDANVISSIPDKFQGIYYCESDSSLFISDRKIIYTESYVEFTTSLQDVSETEICAIVDGGLYIEGMEECIPFEYIGDDMIRAQVREIDTIFNFSVHQIAKYYKGRLFLNYEDQNGKWTTHMLSPESDGSILWELIDISDNVKSVEEITGDYQTKIKSDSSITYIINPTQVEFEKILDQNKTRECDRFIPYNIENPF